MDFLKRFGLSQDIIDVSQTAKHQWFNGPEAKKGKHRVYLGDIWGKFGDVRLALGKYSQHLLPGQP